MLSQQQVLDKYKQGIASGGQRWLDGIMGLTVSPTQQAASPQAMQDYIAGVQASITSGKRLKALNGVSLGDIQQAARQYGQTNYVGSGEKAGSKYAKKLPGLMSLWQAQRAAAAAVSGPKGAESTITAKVLAAVRLAKAAKGNL